MCWKKICAQHNNVFACIVHHSRIKLLCQLFFGAILSFGGVLFLTKIQLFRNLYWHDLSSEINWLPDWESIYKYWLRDSMSGGGLLVIVGAIVIGLWVILAIHSADKQIEKEERKELTKALTELPDKIAEKLNNLLEVNKTTRK